MPAAPRRVVNEPSDGAYMRQRTSAIVAILAIAVSIFSIISNLNTASERRKRQEKEWGQGSKVRSWIGTCCCLQSLPVGLARSSGPLTATA